jgi:hypothetical protein
MYDGTLYDVDERNKQRYDASIQSGAYLYRLAGVNRCTPDQVLSGQGSIYSRQEGRFHIEQQPVSYCANNVLVTFAEVLFHMYKVALMRLGEKQRPQAVRDAVVARRALTLFRVQRIPDLVFIDSEDLRLEFDGRICGATVVYPEATYDVFLDLNRQLRRARKKGIVYPSARHSEGLCFALFDDESANVDVASFRAIEVRLTLIAEDHRFVTPAIGCNPFQEKLHPTMGYYEVLDIPAFENARRDGVLHPSDLPSSGFIDFVRRRYLDYPRQAVCPH